jgi:replicative DNA helicase
MPDATAALDIERAVLGAMLVDTEAVIEAANVLADASYFYEPSYGMIYQAIIDLFSNNAPIDQLTVTDQLKRKGLLDMAGGEETIAALIAETTSTANVRYHCTVLREKRNLRCLHGIGTSLAYDVEHGQGTFDDLYHKTASSLTEMVGNILDANVCAAGDVAGNTLAQIIDRADGKATTGVPTGFELLDKVTGGWQNTNSIVLAGLPGQGKTALALKFALVAAEHEHPVLFFSMEMSQHEIVSRLLAMKAQVPTSGAVKLEDYQRRRLVEAREALSALPFYIDDSASLTSGRLLTRAKMHQRRYGIKMIFVDYLQLMRGYGTDRQQQIEDISRNVKGMAKELAVPVMVLSQFNRDVGSVEDHKRPGLNDLRGSGAIEQDANLVLFIYEPDEKERRYISDRVSDMVAPEEEARIRTLIIAKNRSGPTLEIPMLWAGETYEFGGLK